MKKNALKLKVGLVKEPQRMGYIGQIHSDQNKNICAKIKPFFAKCVSAEGHNCKCNNYCKELYLIPTWAVYFDNRFWAMGQQICPPPNSLLNKLRS